MARPVGQYSCPRNVLATEIRIKLIRFGDYMLLHHGSTRRGRMRDVHRRPLACTQKIQKGYLQAELAIENIPNKGYHDKDIHDTLPLYSQWQRKECDC